MYPYTYPEFNVMYRSSLKEAVDLIMEAIQAEYNNLKLYEIILHIAQAEEDISVINSMIDDEKDHIHTLKNLYKEITGMSFIVQDFTISIPEGYKPALKLCVLSEIKSTGCCNKVYESIEEPRYKSVIQKIINNELKHLSLFNFLFTTAQ